MGLVDGAVGGDLQGGHEAPAENVLAEGEVWLGGVVYVLEFDHAGEGPDDMISVLKGVVPASGERGYALAEGDAEEFG